MTHKRYPGEHWEGRKNGRGLWSKGTEPSEFPGLFADEHLGAARREWFLSYYRQSGECLEWMGARLPFGYGQVNIGGHPYKAHRVAYAMYHGTDPGSKEVCHRCDNPWCGERAHLFLGTHSENERDKVAKGRHRPRKGTAQSNARLTDELVRTLRKAYRSGQGFRPMAREFQIPRTTLKLAVFGETWAHVTDEPPCEPGEGGQRT